MASPAKFATLLIRLAQVVVDTPDENWGMEVWGEKNDCGTTACLAGNASLTPWFKSKGIISEWVRKGVSDDFTLIINKDDYEFSTVDHFSEVFDLCPSQQAVLHKLFISFNSPTKREALNTITQTLKANGYALEWTFV